MVSPALRRLAALALAILALAVLTLAGGLALAAPGPGLAEPWSRAGGEALFAAPAPQAASDRPAASPGPGPSALPGPGVAAGPFAQEIAAAAARHDLDPRLLAALVAVESAFRADAVSPAGAVGLAQLMPATAAELGVADRRDPAANLDGGAAYLARQLARFGDVRLALAAYNAGPARVASAGGVPDIAETRRYTIDVVDCFLALVAGRPVRSAADCRPKENAP